MGSRYDCLLILLREFFLMFLLGIFFVRGSFLVIFFVSRSIFVLIIFLLIVPFSLAFMIINKCLLNVPFFHYNALNEIVLVPLRHVALVTFRVGHVSYK